MNVRIPPTPMDVLNLALKKEIAAYRFYDSALQDAKVGLVRDLFELLREEENRHVQMIKKRITRLALG